MSNWLNDNFKLLVIILMGIQLLLLTGFFIVSALVFNELQGLEISDFPELNEMVSEGKALMIKADNLTTSLMGYKVLIDELPLKDMFNRLNNINAFDKFIWKINQWGGE